MEKLTATIEAEITNANGSPIENIEEAGEFLKAFLFFCNTRLNGGEVFTKKNVVNIKFNPSSIQVKG